METETKTVNITKVVDISDSVFIICVFLLIILTVGSPDLLDAIISRVAK